MLKIHLHHMIRYEFHLLKLLSIHDSYSRFVTVHGTHEAIVKDVVGYNCHGHGFFLEDGYETENKERFLTDL